MMFSLPSALTFALPGRTRWLGIALLVLGVLSALTLAACSGSGSEDTVTVNGDVPIAYV